HPAEAAAWPHDERRGGHSGLPRLRDGRMRPMSTLAGSQDKPRRAMIGATVRAYFCGVLSSAVVLLLVSCEGRFTNDNIDVVNREFSHGENIGKGGVSPKEVESILGPPKRVEPYQLQLETQKKVLDGVRYY